MAAARWSRTAGLAILAAALAYSCSSSTQMADRASTPAPAAAQPTAQASTPAAPPPIVIETIDLREGAPGMQVDVQATGPLVWTSFRNADDDLVLELPNSVPADDLGTAIAGAGVVEDVRIEEATSGNRPLLRLLVATRGEVEHSLSAEGNVLSLQIVPLLGAVAETPTEALTYEPLPSEEPMERAAEPAVGAEETAAAAEETAAAATEPNTASVDDLGTAESPRRGPALEGPGATRLLGVEVVDDGTLLVLGDGELVYETFRLGDPERFVIDLVGVVNTSPESVVPVNRHGVYQVRMAQFQSAPEPIARVVFDLEGPAWPNLERSSEVLSVQFHSLDPAAAAPATEVAEAVVEPPPVYEEPVSEEPAEIAQEPVYEEPAEIAQEPVYEEPAQETYVAEAEPATAPAEVPAEIVEYEAEPEEELNGWKEPVEVATWQEPSVDEMPAEAPQEMPEEMPAEALPEAQPPVEEEPIYEEPVYEEPVYEEPVYEEPAYQEAPAESARRPVQVELPPLQRAASDLDLAPAAPAQGGSVSTRVFGPRVISSGEREYTGEPITMSLRDADVVETLRTFSALSGLSIVVQPQVSGKVTVEFDNVPMDQALEQILKINRLGYEIEGTVMRIAPIDMLKEEAKEQRELAAAKALQIPLQTIIRRLSYADAQEVSQLLRGGGGSRYGLLSQRGSVTVDRRTNTLIIRELPNYMNTIVSLLSELDTPEPQVMIEARIIETTKRFSRSLGVEWLVSGEASPRLGNTTGLVFPSTAEGQGGVNLVSGAENGFINLSLGNLLGSFNLDVALRAAENEGLIKILSAPKVATLNNERASIQSGLQIPIQTVANNTTTVQFINATLSLDVVPHVTAEGTVLMEINIRKREPQLAFAVVGAANAPISTKEARTRVIVRDGGTTVIGGIYEVSSDQGQDRVPGLANIPIIGHLFKNKRRTDENDELLIFITPRVINL